MRTLCEFGSMAPWEVPHVCSSPLANAPQATSSTGEDENKERWEQLSAQVAVEQDGRKLLYLIREISRVMEEERERAEHTAA